jgi:hypothetical protein
MARIHRDCLLFPALAGLVVLTTGIAFPGEGSFQSKAQGSGAATEDPPALCDGWHRGTGRTEPVDLGAVRKAYDDLRRRMAANIKRIGTDAAGILDRPHRSGLQACRAKSVRVENLNLPDAARLKGLTLAFIALRDAALRLPDEVRDDPRALVFILDCPSIRDLGEISKSLGKPVYLAEASFARALGIRCTDSWARISAKGDTVEIHEGD